MLRKICTGIALEISVPENHDTEIIAYGLELLTITILSIISMLVIGFIFGYGIELMIYLVSFGTLRMSARGKHAKNHIICFISYFTMSMAGIHAVRLIPTEFNLVILVVLVMASMFLVYIYAPLQTPKRPIFPKERKRFRKRSIRCIWVFAILTTLLAVFSFWNQALVIAAAIFSESLTLINLKQIEKTKGDVK